MKLTLALLFAGVLCAEHLPDLPKPVTGFVVHGPAAASTGWLLTSLPEQGGTGFIHTTASSNVSTWTFTGSDGTPQRWYVEAEQKRPLSSGWKWSAVVLIGANALDMASSRGLYETNPVLGRGPFGARQVAVKSGLVAGLVLAEYRIIRKWPKAERPFRWLNYVAAGVTVSVAGRNWRQ